MNNRSLNFLCGQPCHVVYTDFRPTPLQHYIFPAGGDGLFLVVDEKVCGFIYFAESHVLKFNSILLSLCHIVVHVNGGSGSQFPIL